MPHIQAQAEANLHEAVLPVPGHTGPSRARRVGLRRISQAGQTAGRAGPGQARPAALCERCRRPSPRIPYCEDCSITVQIEALPEDMMRAWAEKLGIDLGPDINPGLNPEPPGPADREETEIQPRLFTDLPEPEHEQGETQKGLRS